MGCAGSTAPSTSGPTRMPARISPTTTGTKLPPSEPQQRPPEARQDDHEQRSEADVHSGPPPHGPIRSRRLKAQTAAAAAAAATASITSGGAGPERLRGDEPDVLRRARLRRSQRGTPSELAEQLPQERDASPGRKRRRCSRAAGAHRRAPRCRGTASRRAGSWRPPRASSRSDTPACWTAAPAQASDARGERDRRGTRDARAARRPASQPRAADRQREQRLQPLLGLLAARSADLRAGEQADGEHEEQEHERRCSRRASRSSPPPSLCSSRCRLLGDARRGDARRDQPDDEREAAAPEQPARQAAALARAAPARSASRAGRRRGGALSRDGEQAAADVPARRDPRRRRRAASALAARAGASRTSGPRPGERPHLLAHPSGVDPAQPARAPWRCRRPRAAQAQARPPRRRARAPSGASGRAGWRARPTPANTGATATVASAR